MPINYLTNTKINLTGNLLIISSLFNCNHSNYFKIKILKLIQDILKIMFYNTN